jgi:hypothetical protein
MYTQDYGELKSLYEDRLREAENYRKQKELIRAAREYSRREGRGGFLYQLKQQLQRRNQPQQDNTDARHAPAL